nr:hypothetical protein GCM10020092_035640 [Actinoplanes digitatis]
MSRYELVVRGGTLVLPYLGTVRADLATRDGKVAAIADEIPAAEGDEVLDATGRLVFPGAVDAHFHLGIYRPLEVDAAQETRSSLVGGATTVLSYFRTGQHYLNRTGPYGEILPEVLGAVAKATRGPTTASTSRRWTPRRCARCPPSSTATACRASSTTCSTRDSTSPPTRATPRRSP